MAYQFSVGSLTVTPTTGTAFTVGTLQDVSIDFEIGLKELYGSYEYPVDIAAGTKKITGKAKFATINGTQLNDLFWKGSASGTGTTTMTYANQLVGTVIPSFQLVWNINYSGKAFSMTLNKCVSKKLTFSSKLEDYVIPDFDFQGFADSNGNVFSISIVN